MSLEEQVLRYMQDLPESKKDVVLDFIECLRSKTEQGEWSELSLSLAMRGMENEPSVYSQEDIKESFG